MASPPVAGRRNCSEARSSAMVRDHEVTEAGGARTGEFERCVPRQQHGATVLRDREGESAFVPAFARPPGLEERHTGQRRDDVRCPVVPPMDIRAASPKHGEKPSVYGPKIAGPVLHRQDPGAFQRPQVAQR